MKSHSYYKQLIREKLTEIFSVYESFDIKVEPFEIEEECYINIEMDIIFSHKTIYLSVQIDPETEEIRFCYTGAETWIELDSFNLLEYFALKYIWGE